MTTNDYNRIIQALDRLKVAITTLTGSDIQGSGTPGVLPVFSAAQTIGDSYISQSLGSLSASTITFAPTSVMTGNSSAFVFTRPNNRGQTAGANVPGFLYNGGSIEFATGAIATQYSVSLTTATYTAVGASVITNAYGMYVAAPTASTNITITNLRALGLLSGTNTFSFGSQGASTCGIWLNQSSESSSNYAISGTSASTNLNAVTTFNLQVGTTNIITSTVFYTSFTPFAASSGATPMWTFTVPSSTNQTLSTNVPNFKITGATKQWATGALATQYFTYLSANTLSFVGASTATNVYGLYVEAATAGTNATITNNFALGVAGHLNMVAGGIRFSDKTIDTTAGDTVTINSTAGRFRKDTSGSTMTVTNSYVTANSIIILTNTTAGLTTGNQLSVQAGAGSFVVTFETDGVAAAPSANADVNFMVFN